MTPIDDLYLAYYAMFTASNALHRIQCSAHGFPHEDRESGQRGLRLKWSKERENEGEGILRIRRLEQESAVRFR